MTVGELNKQLEEKKVPEDCPVCISHSGLQNAYYTIDKIELSNGFYDDKNHGILLRARE